MKRLIIISVIILAVIICSVLLYTNNQPEIATSKSDKPVVKIGIIHPLSGSGAMYGDIAKVVIRQFFEEFNKKEHKYDYQVILQDNQMNLATSATLAHRLLNVDKVDVLMTFMSGPSFAVAPIAQNSDVIHFAQATDSAVATYKHTLLVTGEPGSKAKLLYDQLVKEGAKTVDIVVQNSSATEDWLIRFNKEVEADKRLSVKNTFRFNDNERDFRIVLAKIKNNNPNYVVVMLLVPLADIFLRQYKIERVNIPLAGADTFNFLEDKSLAEGMWYVDASIPTDDFEKRILAETKSDTTYWGEYLDARLQIITWAYETSNTTNKEEIIKYIIDHSTGMSTAMGPIKTNQDGMITGDMVIKKIENGKRKNMP